MDATAWPNAAGYDLTSEVLTHLHNAAKLRDSRTVKACPLYNRSPPTTVPLYTNIATAQVPHCVDRNRGVPEHLR